MLFFCLLVFGAICLAFDSSRWAGLVSIVLLVFLFPVYFISLAAVGGVGFFLYRHFN